MARLTAADFRHAADEPKQIAQLAEKVAKSMDMSELMRFDTLIASTFCALVIDRRWAEFDAFHTSLVNASLAFEDHAGDWPEDAKDVTAAWDVVLRLAQMLHEMTSRDRAEEFLEARDLAAEILATVQEHEPISSGAIAAALDKSPQSISNALGPMEEHGVVTRRRVGRRTLVRLGPAGLHCPGQADREVPFRVAPDSEFEKNAQDHDYNPKDPSNPAKQMKAVSAEYWSAPAHAAGSTR